MCGIFGIGFLSKYKDYNFIIELTKELLNTVEQRGTDASGVAFITDTKIHIIKNGKSGSVLSNSLKFKNMCKKVANENLLQIIGHCRAETKGSFLHNANNHPIVTNEIVGVHNGFIQNDDKLFKEYPEYIRDGKVDTEIIFRLIDHYSQQENINLIGAVKKTVTKIKGTFACAFVHMMKPHILCLFKEKNPTIIRHYVDNNLIIYCSTDYLIQKALDKIKNNNLKKFNDFPYQSNSSLFINLQTGKFSRDFDMNIS